MFDKGNFIVNIKVKKLQEQAILPYRATSDSAGADLYACLTEPVTILPNQTVKIGTGIAIEIPSGYAAFVYGRSGLGVKYNVAQANCVGVVDADYRGELIVALKNSAQVAFTIHPGDRIAQMVIAPVVMSDFIEVADLSETKRGTGGFGSTGIA